MRKKTAVFKKLGPGKRTAHGAEAAEGGQVNRGSHLRPGQQPEDRGHARYVGYIAVPDDIQGRPGLEFPHDHHFPANIQRSCRAADVYAATVKPGRQIQCAVL